MHIMAGTNEKTSWNNHEEGGNKEIYELADYYRRRVQELEEDLVRLTNDVADCRPSQAEQHKAEWGLRQKEEEKEELQASLNQAQTLLYQERERVVSLKSEVARLEAQYVKDRRTIHTLLSLPTSTHRINSQSEGFIAHPHRLPDNDIEVDLTQGVDGEGLGANEKEQMKEKIRALETELIEVRKVTHERIIALEMDKSQLNQKYVQYSQAMANNLSENQALLQRFRGRLGDSLDECIKAKHNLGERETLWANEKAELKKLISRLTVECESLKKAREQETNKKKEDDIEETMRLVETYQKQAVDMDQECAKVKAEYEAYKDMAERRFKRLDERIAQSTKDFKTEQSARRRDKDGYDADIRGLRSQVKQLQTTMLKLTSEFVGENADRDILALQEIHEANLRTKLILANMNQSNISMKENDVTNTDTT